MAEQFQAKSTGRLAGLAYLVIILFSIFGYSTLDRMLADDPSQAMNRVETYPLLFAAAVGASALGFVAWVVLAALLYRLMAGAGRLYGVLMLLFTAAGVAMSLFALWQLQPLVFPSGLDAVELGRASRAYGRILLLAQVFSGLWLFPFGWLVLRSRVVPRLLGGFLIIAGFYYLLDFARAFAPGLEHATAYEIVTGVTGLAVFLGEFGICMWLLVMGGSEPLLRIAQHAAGAAPAAVTAGS